MSDYCLDIDNVGSLSKPPVPPKGGRFKAIMQFTGLLDSKGKEIWEGDVVRSEQWNPKTFQVGFDRGGFCFFNEGDMYYNDCKYLENFEVIGNIYEHPHLLQP